MVIDIFIELDNENTVTAWGSSSFSRNEVKVSVEDDHEIFSVPTFRDFKLVEGVLVKNEGSRLNEYKRRKLEELDSKCSEAILGRFEVEIGGVMYLFSNDEEAQKNFDKQLTAFRMGFIETNKWTARTLDGEVVRVELNAEEYLTVYMSHLGHIQGNIAKFRDVLEPRVHTASTVQEVAEVTW